MNKKVESKPTKAPRKYQPTRVEVFKTVLIAVLITGMTAFVAGMQFQAKQQDAIQRAVSALAPVAEAKK